jgi:hypothetical protein
VDISTENDSFYCFPEKQNVVTKLAFATEEIFLLHMERKRTADAARRTSPITE